MKVVNHSGSQWSVVRFVVLLLCAAALFLACVVGFVAVAVKAGMVKVADQEPTVTLPVEGSDCLPCSLPSEMLEREFWDANKTGDIGSIGWTTPESVLVDLDQRVWIRAQAPIRAERGGCFQVFVERNYWQGLIVVNHDASYRWTRRSVQGERRSSVQVFKYVPASPGDAGKH